MNSKDFVNILQHPQTITQEQTSSIKSVIDEFPYFQSARAAYLKGLKNQSSYKYNQELKTTAAYTTDRSILFDFITSEAFVQNEISQYIKQNTAHLKDIEVTVDDISVNKNVKEDDTLKQQIKDTIGVLDPSLFQPKEKRPEHAVNPTLEDSVPVEKTPEIPEEAPKTQEVDDIGNILELGKPLEFNKKETHSFNEWLKLTSIRPIEREENEPDAPEDDTLKSEIPLPEPPKTEEHNTSNVLDKAKKFELIDEFITKNPKINPFKAAITKRNLAKAQMIQPEALMTETLARIYVEQKNYKKAIQSYKILSLKYPEKSGFFADQIKAVEQLQEQNKTE